MAGGLLVELEPSVRTQLARSSSHGTPSQGSGVLEISPVGAAKGLPGRNGQRLSSPITINMAFCMDIACLMRCEVQRRTIHTSLRMFALNSQHFGPTIDWGINSIGAAACLRCLTTACCRVLQHCCVPTLQQVPTRMQPPRYQPDASPIDSYRLPSLSEARTVHSGGEVTHTGRLACAMDFARVLPAGSRR